jgi:DNA-directed RNA polymerase specialized sigma24 family protein
MTTSSAVSLAPLSRKSFDSWFSQNFTKLKTHALICAFGKSPLAEDVVNAVYVSLVAKLGAMPVEVRDWNAYVRRSIRNETLNKFRGDALKRALSDQLTVAAKRLIDEGIQFGASLELRELLDATNPTSREVVYLKAIEGYPHREIVNELGKPSPARVAVRMTVANSRRILCDNLKHIRRALQAVGPPPATPSPSSSAAPPSGGGTP